MQILIWKAYGNIGVHCAETTKQLESILSDVIDCVKYVTSPDDIPLINEYIDSIKTSIDNNHLLSTKKLINNLIEEYSLVGNHESFEEFYFDKVKYG